MHDEQRFLRQWQEIHEKFQGLESLDQIELLVQLSSELEPIPESVTQHPVIGCASHTTIGIQLNPAFCIYGYSDSSLVAGYLRVLQCATAGCEVRTIHEGLQGQVELFLSTTTLRSSISPRRMNALGLLISLVIELTASHAK